MEKMAGRPTPGCLSDLEMESEEPTEVGKKAGRKKGRKWNILKVSRDCCRRKLNMTRMRIN